MDEDGSSSDEAKPGAPPPLPKKHYQLFTIESNSGFCTKDIFEGKMGELPILIAVNVGYNPEEEDPFMYPYESDEILFAYKLDRQKRVMLQDSLQQTWSLPVSSPLRFDTKSAKELTLPQLLETEALPVDVFFTEQKWLRFKNRNPAVPKPCLFDRLKLTNVYYEPFFWCLSISMSGTVEEKPRVLPRNLSEICFSHIISVAGAADPRAKLAEYKERFSRIAEQNTFQGDPFFQEMALLCRGPQPVDTVHPYIDQDTFVTYKILPRQETGLKPPRHSVPRKPPPAPPTLDDETGTLEPPPPDANEEWYSALDFDNDGYDPHLYDDNSVYQQPRDLGIPASNDENEDNNNSNNTFAPMTDRPLPMPPNQDVPRSDCSGKQHPMFSPSHSADLSAQKRSDTGTRKSSLDSRPSAFVEPFSATGDHSKASSALSYPLSMKASNTLPPQLPPRRRGVDLKALTVDDLSEKLKELGLNKKLVKKFYKNRIDGVLLEKLTEATLKKEFGMTHVEFLLLNTYVTEGHVPQTSSPSGGSLDKK